MSFWTKLVFILVEIALAVAFAYFTFRERYNTGAILEWVIAGVFTGYVVSFVLDLLPSVRTKCRVSKGSEDQMAMQQGPSRMYGRENNHDRGVSVHGAGPGEYEQDLTRDSAGPVANPPHGANGYQNGSNGYTKETGRKATWTSRWRNF